MFTLAEDINLEQLAWNLSVWMWTDVVPNSKGKKDTGQLHAPILELQKTIKRLEGKKIIKKGQKVLDLGSGFGSASFMLSAAGYDVTGYELNRQCLRVANQKKQALKSTAKFLQDSYFPKSFLSRRKASPELENMEDFQDAPEYLFVTPGRITPAQLKSYDIFYIYPWKIQIPSVFELFKLYARDDAILLCAGASGYMADTIKLTAKKIGLRQVEDEVFRKSK